MLTPAERARKVLKEQGMARSRELERAGISRSQIQRLVRQGVLERVSRGLCRLAGTPLAATED